ncbi:hypothetical protein [Salinibacterium sp.]|uniref:hypothetical protein n=1 Tax=Salinibacterium sp. TaxID=1915057 RepID=UPI00286BACAF|nr:hypothetical protein [Salinibacterium sp.]
MKLTLTLILVSSSALLLAGCAAATPETVTPETITPAEGLTYGSVEDLREAFESAGGECDGWVQSNQVKAAAESGACGTKAVLSTFASESDRDDSASTLKMLMADVGGVELLVGANWIINSDGVSELQETLGGTIINSKQ